MVFWSGFIKKIKNAVTKERVDKLEQKINTNAANIELVEQDVDTNTNNIRTIRNDMLMLTQEDNNIKRRLEQAETNITQTNNELDSLEANVNGFDARITEANTKATNAEEQATRLGLTVSTNSTKITVLETKNTELTNKVNTNTTSINDLVSKKVKVIEVSISSFRKDRSKPNSNGRMQTYTYQLSKLNINSDRIISFKVYTSEQVGYFATDYGSVSVWESSDYIRLCFVSYLTDTSEFQVAGSVYIYYI